MVVHVDEVSQNTVFGDEERKGISQDRIRTFPSLNLPFLPGRASLTKPQLHNSHLASRSMPYDEFDANKKPDLAIPYLLRPTRESLDSALDSWAKICGADIVDSVGADGGEKQIIVVDFSKDGESRSYKRLCGPHNVLICLDLAQVPVPASRHLMLLTGTHPPIDKRQERPFPQRPSSTSASSSSSTSTSTSTSTSSATPSSGRHNSTIPTGGPLLDRVQILTTPIITGVLISFLIFLPIIGFGIWALASIQVPPRMMEISKGMVVSKDKKDN